MGARNPTQEKLTMHSPAVSAGRFAFIAISVLVFASPLLVAQSADPGLVAEINQIKAIDNHSHPPKLVAGGEKDDDFDALPCAPLEPTAPNLMGRGDNPKILAAWKALYGYQHEDASPAHVRELLAAKDRVKQREGDNYA